MAAEERDEWVCGDCGACFPGTTGPVDHDTECASCGAVVPCEEGLPDVDDADGWKEIRHIHSHRCEWIEDHAPVREEDE